MTGHLFQSDPLFLYYTDWAFCLESHGSQRQGWGTLSVPYQRRRDGGTHSNPQKSNDFLFLKPHLLPLRGGDGGSFSVEGTAHIPSILRALSVQGSVMSMLAPRGVTQACGLSGLVRIGMGPESAWLGKKGGGERWNQQV